MRSLLVELSKTGHEQFWCGAQNGILATADFRFPREFQVCSKKKYLYSLHQWIYLPAEVERRVRECAYRTRNCSFCVVGAGAASQLMFRARNFLPHEVYPEIADEAKHEKVLPVFLTRRLFYHCHLLVRSSSEAK